MVVVVSFGTMLTIFLWIGGIWIAFWILTLPFRAIGAIAAAGYDHSG
jgi:hypothetical protein